MDGPHETAVVTGLGQRAEMAEYERWCIDSIELLREDAVDDRTCAVYFTGWMTTASSGRAAMRCRLAR